jgi:hypothetical protein
VAVCGSVVLTWLYYRYRKNRKQRGVASAARVDIVNVRIP